MYGRFCIKFPQSRMKGERHRQAQPTEPLVCCCLGDKNIIFKIYEKNDDFVFYISEYNTLNSACMYACLVIDCLKYKDTQI